MGEYDSVWCGPRTRLMWNDMDSTARFYARTAQGEKKGREFLSSAAETGMSEIGKRWSAARESRLEAAAYREGVIEGLERAFKLATMQPNPLRAIGAEIERLKGE